MKNVLGDELMKMLQKETNGMIEEDFVTKC